MLTALIALYRAKRRRIIKRLAPQPLRCGALAASVAWATVGCARVIPRATAVNATACATADVIATDTAGLLPYAHCRELQSLTVRSGAAVDFTVLAKLTFVTGDLRIGPSLGITEISLPGLQAVGGTLRVAGNTVASGLYTKQLQHIGMLEIADNATLSTLALSALEHVTGNVTIARNGDLSTVLAPRWTKVGGVFRLQSCRSLEFVEIDPTFSAAAVQISDIPKLDWQSIPGGPAKPLQLPSDPTSAGARHDRPAGEGLSSPGDPAF